MLVRIGKYEVEISARLIGNEEEASASSTESLLHALEIICRDASSYNLKERYSGTAFRCYQIAENIHDALEARGYYD